MPNSLLCPDVESLQRLATDDLSADEALHLQQHLVRCHECARLTQDLKDAACLLQSTSGTPGSAALVATPTSTPLGDASGEYGFLAPPREPGALGRLGPYVVRRVVGSGGMGLVFEAEDPHLLRPVALKILHAALAGNEAYRQRFLQEARAAARIDHENIVTIYGAGEERGVLYLAMQFLRGETLEDRLRREPRLASAQVVRIGREVASGLAAAHERGLVHRDVKPANIWLEAGSGRVKLLDFGLARAPGAAGPRLTRTGVVMGTPGYMAPEQTRTRDAIDHRCDLFGLGCVLYQLCTGKLAFDNSDPVTAVVALATVKPVPPHKVHAEIPLALSDLVMRLLEKDPADRPPTARTVAEELGRIERNGTRPATAGPACMPVVRAAGVSDRESVLLSVRAVKKASGGLPAPGARRTRDLVVAGITLVLVGLASLAAYHLTPVVSRLVADTETVTSQPDP